MLSDKNFFLGVLCGKALLMWIAAGDPTKTKSKTGEAQHGGPID
jgi:hypothetical protein